MPKLYVFASDRAPTHGEALTLTTAAASANGGRVTTPSAAGTQQDPIIAEFSTMESASKAARSVWGNPAIDYSSVMADPSIAPGTASKPEPKTEAEKISEAVSFLVEGTKSTKEAVDFLLTA